MSTAILFNFRKNSAPAKKLPAGHRAKVIPFPGTALPAPAPAPKARPPKRKRGNTQEADQRHGLYAKINIALRGKNGEPGLFAKLPHFDEGFYRDELDRRYNLQERFDRISAADLELHELEQVIKWLSGLGWKAKKGRNRKNAPETLFKDDSGMSREAKMKKIEAFLAEKGRKEGTDVPWGYAVSILKRQTANAPGGQVKSFEKASPQQLDDVIAALYRDAKRNRRKVR